MSLSLRPATRPQAARGRSPVLPLVLACAALAAGASSRAELPVETLTATALPADASRRLYVSDAALPHIADSRVLVVDGDTMRYLGMVGTGYFAQTALTPDGRYLLNATTYHARGDRGPRSDVLEVWRTSDLGLEFEVELPPKHAQSLYAKALTATTRDGRFVLLQNATPATSVTVVDLQKRSVVAELPNPGCWGLLPWIDGTNRFSSVCGDGTLKTFALDAEGRPRDLQASAKFFDPDRDPVYMHFERQGDRILMLSYGGAVHSLRLSGEAPAFDPTWSLLQEQDRQEGWVPGGIQLFAADPNGTRLAVGMHSKGQEGSHKRPAEQLWLFDTANHQRLDRVPGRHAIGMAVSAKAPARLYVLNAAEATVASFDMNAPEALRKPLRVSDRIGETPVYLGVAP